MTLESLNLPTPHLEFDQYHILGSNRLIREERARPNERWEELWARLNPDQRIAADTISDAVDLDGNGGVYFVDGPGGTGKTTLQNTVMAKIRAQGHIALAVASSGIASTLLAGGRTAHSRFKIPLNADARASCGVKKLTDLAELLQEVKLIFWDEISAQNKHDVEAVDQMLQDIRGNKDSFGGVVVCFCGDFRQTLPIVPGAGPGRTIGACLKKSYLWNETTVLQLTINMRLFNPNLTEQCRKDTEEFARKLLAIGSGSGPGNSAEWEYGFVKENTTAALIQTIYSDLCRLHILDNQYFASRAILAGTNKHVASLNQLILTLLRGIEHTSVSLNQVVCEEEGELMPVEYMNSLEDASLPPHILKLKIGCPVMLLRNLDASRNLCNGTRLRVHRVGTKILECRILGGEDNGEIHLIPRIPLQSPDKTKFHTKFKRTQFPVRLAFAMTINKSQGQSLEHVGVNLDPQVFAHGQLYVAFSRVTNLHGLHIIVPQVLSFPQPDLPKRRITNVVYSQVLK